MDKTSMPRQSPWEIRVGRKADILAELLVPVHKLQRQALSAFLKALVVRFSTDTPEDMLTFYVNGTRGLPTRLLLAEVKPCEDLDRNRIGYWCGTWECYAVAMREIPVGHAVWMKEQRTKNCLATMRTDGASNFDKRGT